MPESPPLRDGETRLIRSESGSQYEVKNVGGAYSCSCPGWRNQSRHPQYRTCKHLVDFRGARDEAQRIFPGGQAGMPGSIASRVLPHWPASGAGRAHDIATGRLPVEPAPTPGGRSMRHPVTKRSAPGRDPLVSRGAEPPKKAHNAWTAILDDDHPLAEPVPPPPPPKTAGALTKLGRPSGPPPESPANDFVKVRPPSDDEPEWESDLAHAEAAKLIAEVGPSDVLDPAKIIEAASAKRGGFRGVLLAESWNGVQNVTGWVMSEKLDGVRAYWDGENFYSRLGNVFAVPDWYKEGMPKDVHLDGEFWIGRGQFQKTSGYVRRMDRGEYWKTINYMVFDAPSMDAGFEARIAAIGSIKLPTHVKLLPHAACPTIAVLRTYLAAIEEAGGEGVMLRQPGSRYVRTRSSTLLKVKTFFDTEAEVVGTTAGKGRHDGAVGALEVVVREAITLKAGKKTCTIKAGTEFEVGTGLVDAQRRPGAIPIGSRITFRFQELSTDGIPRFPSLVGVRNYE
jgi:DNA ligase 1